MKNQKPTLSKKQIWDLNLGFLGLQIAFSLLMTNTSRIFSALGADTDLLSLLWIAPPLAGLIVQPLIGYMSDRKWSRFGRRIPFIFIGSIISCVLLSIVPNLSTDNHIIYPIWDEVMLLFLLQAAFNVSMLSFRSLIGDLLNTKQQNFGFSIQTFFCNVGGIAGALLPFLLDVFGMRNEPIENERLAPTLSYSFYTGAILLLITVLWTCLKTKEYPPNKYSDETNEDKTITIDNGLPKDRFIMYKLSFIQFFSWLGFFFLWVYTTDAIAQRIWHTSDALSESYNDAGNWFGVLTSFYSIISIIFSLFLPRLANRYGSKVVYFLSLIVSGVGLVSIYFINDEYLLLLPMIAIGIGWSSMLTFPFSIIAAQSPPDKMGLQMGLLNITITLPQIAGSVFGVVLFKYLANSDSMAMILYAGISLFISAFFVLGLKKEAKTQKDMCEKKY